MTDDPSSPLHAVLGALPQAAPFMALLDAEGRVIWANETYEQAYLRGLALPVHFDDVLRHGFKHGFGLKVDCGDIETFLLHKPALYRKVPYRAFATDLVDGRWIWMTETMLPDGGMLLVGSDISSLKAQEALLEQARRMAVHASLTDELTGTSNRRHILELCRGVAASHGDDALTVALFDLDNFKSINDRHGHDMGDAVLRHFVSHCRAGLRPGDHLGRLGGEEFLLLLPQASLEVADAVVNRLRASHTPCGDLAYGFSAGLAQAGPGEPLESVVARADEALYAAKFAGKGCNRIAGPRQEAA